MEWVRSLDPTRLVDATSGWTDRGVGDVIDVHSYPGPAAPPNQPDRAAVLGEFGGLGLPVRGHTWQEEKNWGYRSFTTPEELTEAYLALIEKLKPLITGGVSAAVYTQTTDVEVEVNGLLTYDRAVIKMDKDKVSQANRSVYSAMAAPGSSAGGGRNRMSGGSTMEHENRPQEIPQDHVRRSGGRRAGNGKAGRGGTLGAVPDRRPRSTGPSSTDERARRSRVASGSRSPGRRPSAIGSS